MKLCINCKFKTEDSETGKPLCERPGVEIEENAVDGSLAVPSCESQRVNVGWLGTLLFGKHCGKEGQFFEPKDESRSESAASTTENSG